ncbi:MAG: SUMF1/EgtB/PvdO family nonheme iron enzyme [Pseudomonadota bacterium]
MGEAQKALNDIGFDAGPNDGIPGAKTISAIALFKESRGLTETGQLTEAQHGRLLADAQLAAEGRLVSMLPEMVGIPAGCFQMGSPADEDGRQDNERQHRVWVEAFKIGRTEVTQRQWRELMGDNPSSFKGCDDCPVESVSWHDVQGFLQKLNTQTGKMFRLPNQAEWEYAARAGTTGPFSLQGRISADKANYNANYTYAGSSRGSYRGKTVPTGSLPANPWGLHEVHGNVWEWTCSAYDEKYEGSETQCAGSSDSALRVGHGGSWDSLPRSLRSATRDGDTPANRSSSVGFRLAQD